MQAKLSFNGQVHVTFLSAHTYYTVILVQANSALAVAEASIDELQQQLIAAEEARDEFVDLLSPKKAPRPAGSPAPKATETQLRAALKVALSLYLMHLWT